MRVALCFSGQLRNVQSTYDGWWKPNVLDINRHHQIDVFGHSWFDNTTIGTEYYAANHIPTYMKANSPIPNNIIQQVYDCYNPKKLVLEQQVIFDDKDYNERKLMDAVPINGISRLYSQYQANLSKRQYEKDNGFIYDVVVCSRYDLILYEPVFFDIVSQSGIYHPGYAPPQWINSNYVMGSSVSIDQYAELYLNYDAIYRTGIIWSDEVLANAYLVYSGIPIYDFHIRHSINRTGG